MLEKVGIFKRFGVAEVELKPVAAVGDIINVDGVNYKVTRIAQVPSIFMPLAPRGSVSSIPASSPNALSYQCYDNPAEIQTNQGPGASVSWLYQLWFLYVNFPVMINVAYNGCQNYQFETPNFQYVSISWETPPELAYFWTGLSVRPDIVVFNPWPFQIPDGYHVSQLYAVLGGYGYQVKPLSEQEATKVSTGEIKPLLITSFAPLALTATASSAQR